uniref:Retinoic acid induced 16-like protein n=1 Tax=Bionectria ochroleuca TaxID=29856 RepID=A0A0B7K4J1_BIOOC
MDFWSRLLSPLSKESTRQDQAKDPAKRLHRFEKQYGKLLATWRTSNISRDSDAAETVEIGLQELTNIISDESRRPLPHPCIQFASLREIYVHIGKIAIISYNEWIIKEAVLFFATLIESEEEAFVEKHTFSTSLTNLLVRITGANSVPLGLDTESRVVELAFNITTKIRQDPAILPAWFNTHEDDPKYAEGDRDYRDKFAGRTQRADFPLFYILMDYIHHEGKVGDFARTGLLYIIESASRSVLLEQWIVESDLSTLMATGLGALYSQLSRKLVIDYPTQNLPPILAFSDYQHPTSNFEIISSCSPEFQSHLETFLSHLLFWQDVLNHCKSVEVKSTLLEHFQVIFLQQLLYPSLLESSDIDGGSSVAVLTYLRRILEALDHPDMIHLILHYLLALPDTEPAQDLSSSTTSISNARKRKSMDLATMMASKSDSTVTPLLFNLVDLILACLRSRNRQTIHVTLQLVSAILKRHHRYAIITLLRTEILPGHTLQRTIGAHDQEVEYLVNLAGAIGGFDNFNDLYDDLLKDTKSRLESHSCSIPLMAPPVGKIKGREATFRNEHPGSPREVREHTLRVDDPLLNAMLDLLESFFLNPVETNLSVTESLVDLGICGYMSVEGWLTRNPENYIYDEEEEDQDEEDVEDVEVDKEESEGEAQKEELEQEGQKEEQTEAETVAEQTEKEGNDSAEKSAPEPRLDSRPKVVTSQKATEVRDPRKHHEAQQEKEMRKCRRRPTWEPSSVPRFLAVIKRLCEQVDGYKEMIPRFEELLQQRREAFYTADRVLSTPVPSRKETPKLVQADWMEETPRSSSPLRPSGFEGFAQRIFSELGTPSRSGSPKGRKEKGMGTRSGAATPSHRIDNYGLASPKAIPIPAPKDLTLGQHEPVKGALPRTLSPSLIGDDGMDDIEGDEGVHASRMADFAAVDQTILARRVGLPHREEIEPIPLRFNKQALSEPDDTIEVDDEENMHIGPGAEELDGIGDEYGTGDDEDEDLGRESVVINDGTVSVSHVVTNVLILQSFVFEVASLMQMRASLFNEVRFV